MSERTRVLYIGGLGRGRSGSTLLAALIAQTVEDSISVGELRSVWGVAARDELCGCGLPFSGCAFWQAVGSCGDGLWEPAHVQRMLTLSHLCCRHRSLVTRRMAPALRRSEEREFQHSLQRLYKAIRRVSGASIVIDSTKDPAYADMLQRMGSIRLEIVHLVRDPRAVAAAMMKIRVRPEVVSESKLMPRAKSFRAAGEWVVDNAWFDFKRKRGLRSARIRYEDLATDPRAVLEMVLRRFDIDADIESVTLHSVAFQGRSVHSVGGNPARFDGSAPVRLDVGWRQDGLRTKDSLAVVCLAWPLMRRYGYHLLVSDRHSQYS